MGVSGGCRYNKSELLFVSCALTHSANGQAHHTTTIATDARLNQPGSFVRVVADSPRTQQLSRVLQHHRLLQVLCDPFASCRPCLRFDLCALLAMTQVTTERIQSRTHARCDVAGARNTFYENMVRVLLSDLLSSRLAFHLESLSHVYTLPHCVKEARVRTIVFPGLVRTIVFPGLMQMFRATMPQTKQSVCGCVSDVRE